MTRLAVFTVLIKAGNTMQDILDGAVAGKGIEGAYEASKAWSEAVHRYLTVVRP